MAKQLFTASQVCEKLGLTLGQVRYATLKLALEHKETDTTVRGGPGKVRGYDLLDINKIKEYQRALHVV